MELSPTDSDVVKVYIKAIRTSASKDLWGGVDVGFSRRCNQNPTFNDSASTVFQANYAAVCGTVFKSIPQKGFSTFGILDSICAFLLHLAKHAYGFNRDIAWPVGGSLAFARSIEKRYKELGGEVHYHQKVEKILVENNKAAGVRLSDGSEHRATSTGALFSNANSGKKIIKAICSVDGKKFLEDR